MRIGRRQVQNSGPRLDDFEYHRSDDTAFFRCSGGPVTHDKEAHRPRLPRLSPMT
jgi:hypothetical protein